MVIARTPGLTSPRPVCAAMLLCSLWFAAGVQAQTSPGSPALRNGAEGGARGAAHGAEGDAVILRELAGAREEIRNGRLFAGQRRLEALIARYPDHRPTEEARWEIAALYLRKSTLAGESQRSNLGAALPPVGAGRWHVEIRRGTLLADRFRASAGDRVFFAASSFELGRRARDALSAQARWLKAHPDVGVRIEGHADDPGSEADNRLLAGRRGEAVRRNLIEEGVAPGRLQVVAHGAARRVALCAEAVCSAQNRRAITRLEEADGGRNASAASADGRGTGGGTRALPR